MHFSRRRGMAILSLLAAVFSSSTAFAIPPGPPDNVKAKDHSFDGGDKIDVSFKLSLSDVADEKKTRVAGYVIQRAGEYGGKYEDVLRVKAEKKEYRSGRMKVEIEKCERGEPYFFRVRAFNAKGEKSTYAETTEKVIATREWFAIGRAAMAVFTFVICGAVIWYILHARSGKKFTIRKIAGLEAFDEAVGRATEMGRSCLFIPGVQDMNDIQTITGLTILSRVAQVAAEYGAKIEVPTSRSLVMTTAQETVESAFLAAGKPDEYNADDVYYVTDEQFGYVAYLAGMMVREKPAACFYMGSFFAESLILAETGNAIGAIQIAGTAQPAQLPFFVAACDYTLIGEEFFAASAILSKDPIQLGSLKGQDVGKLVAAALLIIGCALWSAGNVLTENDRMGGETFINAKDYLRDMVLSTSS